MAEHLTRRLLDVRVVWHPSDAATSKTVPVALPHQIFRQLHADPQLPASERAGLPVWLHTTTSRGELPAEIPFPEDRHTLVVLLVGRHLLRAETWKRWVRALRQAVEAAEGRATLLPIGLVEAAVGQKAMLGEIAVERAFDQSSLVERDRGARIAVLRTIARLLNGEEPLTVFVSHAKIDARRVARALADNLDELKGHTWIDVEQIESGKNFRKVLEKALDNPQSTMFVAVVSDTYATREWCRWEAQIARLHGLSTVVLDMVSEGQRRSLPALGNAPVIRFNAPPPQDDDQPLTPDGAIACRRVLEAVLLERVNTTWFPHRVAALADHLDAVRDGWELFSTPPDVLSLACRAEQLRSALYAVYPDPPLPSFELDLLAGLASNVAGEGRSVPLVTPTSLIPRVSAGLLDASAQSAPLRVAISISKSPKAELQRCLMSGDHVDALFMNLCRLLLANGHTLVYGGDPLQSFTVALGDIERTHHFVRPGEEPRLVNYVAHYLRDLPAFEALGDVMEVIRVGRRRSAAEPEHLRPLLDLTAMRLKMVAETDLRIVAAGDPMPGRSGERRGPGVLEEAYLTLQEEQPLLVIGGYGGAGRLLADALHGSLAPQEIDALRRHFVDRATLAEFQRAYAFDDMLSAFHPGVDLRNGLSVDQNERLLASRDPDEIAALVMLSLQRTAPS